MDINELETADYDILENLKAAFHRLWKFKMVVVLFTLIGLLSSFAFFSVVNNQTIYSAASGIYSAMYGSYEDSTDGVRVMNSYASMLGTSPVCERAAETLSDPDLTALDLQHMVKNGEIYLAGVSGNSREYSYRLTLMVETVNANRIIDVANAMAQAFADEINDFQGVSTLRILDPATSIYTSKTINTTMYMVLFTAAGFFLSAAFIFIKEFFSSKVYTIGQCEARQELVLGLIPYSNKK